MLVDDEKLYRENRRLQRLLGKARLRQPAALEDIDYRHARGLNRQVIAELSGSRWLETHRTVILTGPAGIHTKDFMSFMVIFKRFYTQRQ